jgi:transposase-like protein
VTRECPAKEIARKHGVERPSLYFWKNQMLGEDYEVSKNQFTQEDVGTMKRESSSRWEV